MEGNGEFDIWVILEDFLETFLRIFGEIGLLLEEDFKELPYIRDQERK